MIFAKDYAKFLQWKKIGKCVGFCGLRSGLGLWRHRAGFVFVREDGEIEAGGGWEIEDWKWKIGD